MSTSRLNRLWTARQLNDAVAQAAGDVFVECGPDGRIDTRDFSAPRPQRQLARPRNHGAAMVRPMVGSNEFDAGLQRLPSLLAFLAINPEPWCWTMISSGALESIGPFLDYVNPLWEWLVRAARADKARFALVPGLTQLWGHRHDFKLDRERVPLPQLVHGDQSGAPRWLRGILDNVELAQIVDNVTSTADATAVWAGLMELHDVGESHELAQSIEGQGKNRAGDYWHAIHHRREPDVGNAKYWLRRVGVHPIHVNLAATIDDLVSSEITPDQATDVDRALRNLIRNGVWDAFAFADLCNEAPASQNPDLIWAARQLQFLEMTLLLDSAYEDATS